MFSRFLNNIVFLLLFKPFVLKNIFTNYFRFIIPLNKNNV